VFTVTLVVKICLFGNLLSCSEWWSDVSNSYKFYHDMQMQRIQLKLRAISLCKYFIFEFKQPPSPSSLQWTLTCMFSFSFGTKLN
jgi:hypothetical protein